ncbi:MAG: hypothetical protein WA919_20310 [Coleofasciculaceae cyanobacterium]
MPKTTDPVTQFIEGQEKDGSKFISDYEVLPWEKDADREIACRWGVDYIEPVDKLFWRVKLLQGWQKVSSSSYWTKLLDDRGLKRASIFYKAAFYDREAFLSAHVRFSQSQDYRQDDFIRFVVTDIGRDVVVFKGTPIYHAVSSDGILGATDLRDFYSLPVPSDDNGGSFFSEVLPLSSSDRILTLNEFYQEFHDRNITNHQTIRAAKALAQKSVSAWFEAVELPQNTDLWWGADYDFPAV